MARPLRTTVLLRSLVALVLGVAVGVVVGPFLGVAAALLALPEDEASEDDVADAVGELVNMIGGNVKSLVESPSALSLPHVVTQPGTHQSWPGAKEVCRIDGTWNGEAVTVMVYAGVNEGKS